MSDEKNDGITPEQRDALKAIGRKGGLASRAKLGKEHYQRIGKMGGSKVAAERGHDFYVEIGKKGGAKLREIMEAGRAALAAKGGGDGEG